MPGKMELRIWDVEHGACAMLWHVDVAGRAGSLAMIDSGCTGEWRPSVHIKKALGREALDYLFITNADQDHMSDLEGLWDEDVDVKTLIRNKRISAEQLRDIKKKSGPLSDDAERYLKIHSTYTHPVSKPFNDHMGGITFVSFSNPYPDFEDTNNLSLVVFIKFGGFSILFPGDLEGPGWEALLQQEKFREELRRVTILVASHHGRKNGYLDDVFSYCKPMAIVISDKEKVHGTQEMVPTYRLRVTDNYPDGVLVASTGKRRHVLTTRRDGWINFSVGDNGAFTISTETNG